MVKKIFSLLLAITMLAVAVPVVTASAKTDVVKYGDIHIDGEINIIDLVALKKKLASECDYITNRNCDCNRDRAVDSGDLVALRLHLLGTQNINQYGD